MNRPHVCHGCLSRRHCLQRMTLAAAGLTFGGPFLKGAARAVEPSADFVDPATLRPRPKVRIESAILEKPRPYWLGWPGTTYDLDKHQAEYGAWLKKSCQRLAIDLREEAKPVEQDEAVAAFIAGVKDRHPDGVLLILQHIHCWPWISRIREETGVPLVVFAPVGTAFTGHVGRISFEPGVHVVSSLE